MNKEDELGEIQEKIYNLDKNLEQQREEMIVLFDQLLASYYTNRPHLVNVDEFQFSLEILESWLQEHLANE